MRDGKRLLVKQAKIKLKETEAYIVSSIHLGTVIQMRCSGSMRQSFELLHINQYLYELHMTTAMM